MPVMIAASQVPELPPATAIRLRRRAPKKKPRKKNSSAIGAITHTNTAAVTKATVLRLTPSSLGSFSLPFSPNKFAYTVVTR